MKSNQYLSFEENQDNNNYSFLDDIKDKKIENQKQKLFKNLNEMQQKIFLDFYFLEIFKK